MTSLKYKWPAYSALAVGVMATQPAEAQEVYTDINPDTLLDFTGESMVLDFNDDGIDDLQIIASFGTFTYSSTSGVSTYVANSLKFMPLTGCEITVTNEGTPRFVPAEDTISYGSVLTPFGSGETFAIANNSYTPQFIGFKLTDGAGTHFGWLRLHVHDENVAILDFAYQILDGVSIQAHAPNTPYMVKNIQVTDIADNHDPSDIQVSFEVPDDESAIASYRIFVNYSSDIELLNSAVPEMYTEVLPDGADKVVTLNPDQLSPLGPIQEFYYYYSIKVESVSNTEPNECVVATDPDIFIYGFKLPPVQSAEIYQVAAAHPWDAMKVNFTTPASIDHICNYFTYVVPFSELPVVDSMFFFTNENRTVINDYDVPDETWYPSTSYTGGVMQLDVNGNTIKYGIPYSVCVQSHTFLIDYFTDYRYETLFCSPAYTLVNPGVDISEAEKPLTFLIVEGNYFQLNLPASCQFPAQLKIFNYAGQIVAEIIINENNTSFSLDLPPGSYIATLQDANSEYSQKIIYDKQ